MLFLNRWNQRSTTNSRAASRSLLIRGIPGQPAAQASSRRRVAGTAATMTPCLRALLFPAVPAHVPAQILAQALAQILARIPSPMPSRAIQQARATAKPARQKTCRAAVKKKILATFGLLGGKSIFGQRGSKQQDDRRRDADRSNGRDEDDREGRNQQRSIFGAGNDHADENRAASEAYAREASRFESQEDDSHHMPANPWDAAPEPDGWIPAFYHTCMRVMFGAHNFYDHVRADTPQVRPLVFYLIISVVQVIIERVWSGIFLSLMSPSAASDPELEKMLILLSPQLSLPMTILLKTGVSVVQLYVLTALMHFTYGFITGKRPEFSLVFQVAAYAAAPSLLCVVPLLGSIVGFIWMVACVLVGCRTVLNLTWPQAFMGFAPVVLLLAPLLLQVMKAAQF